MKKQNVKFPKKSHVILRSFVSYYKPQAKLFWADTACALVQAGLDLVFPVILRWLASDFFANPALFGGSNIGDAGAADTTGVTGASFSILGIPANDAYAAIFILGIGLLIMYAIRFGCKYFISAWGHIMGARMESAMRQDLFNQYERFSFSYYDRHNTGDLMSRLINDLFDISEVAHHGPEHAIVCTAEIVGAFIIMFMLNWVLAAWMAAATVLLIIYCVLVNRMRHGIWIENRVKISGVNSQLEDSLQGARVVKSFANEGHESKKFEKANVKYLKSRERMYKALGNYQAATSLLTGALYTIIIVVGGFLILDGKMTALDLSTYALYVGLLATPVQTLVDQTDSIQKAIAGYGRFYEVLATKPDIESKPGAPDIAVSKGQIEYKDVKFAYDTAKQSADNPDHVLRGLNLKIEAGKTYAFVGPSGGGKSTICSLLPRFYDVNDGSITIDGQDVRDVDLDSLHRAIGIVQQDVYLFDGTIAENIGYGKIGASMDEIIEAAKAANIYDFIVSLPEGFETQCGERGGRLSGGQKQRIAIARVFLKDPQILVLDEATSALDNESEAAVQESLKRLAEGRTTLVIAHRLSTIKDADVIVAIDRGQVAQTGTHEQLMEEGGIYAQYYRMQFGDR